MKKILVALLAATITVSVYAGLETFTGAYIDDLNTAWPIGASDLKSEGDDHIRGIKLVLQNTFPNITGAVNSNQTELNYLDGSIAGTGVASKALVLDGAKGLNTGGALNMASTTVTGISSLNGHVSLGDTDADNIAVNGDITTDLTPNNSISYDLGSTTNEWVDLWVTGTAHIDSLTLDVGATVNDIDTAMAASPADDELLTAQAIQETFEGGGSSISTSSVTVDATYTSFATVGTGVTLSANASGSVLVVFSGTITGGTAQHGYKFRIIDGGGAVIHTSGLYVTDGDGAGGFHVYPSITAVDTTPSGGGSGYRLQAVRSSSGGATETLEGTLLVWEVL